MAYATLADLYARFGETEITQVADTDGTGTPDAVAVERALGDAAAEIDAALQGRYRLPMAAVPALLTRIACDLARESLYADQPTKTVSDRAKAARDLLAGLASGRLRLEAEAAASPGGNAIQAGARIAKGRQRMRWPK